MALVPFVRRTDAYLLVVGMAGVKMGDRLVQIGCEHAGRLGAVASKVGLSGRAAAIVPDEASAARARKGAADHGALVEVSVGPPTSLPFDDGSFDVAVVDDTRGLIGSLSSDQRAIAIAQMLRVLRPGGRVVFLGAVPRAGLSALFARTHEGPPFAASGALHEVLTADGFRSVRTLAERDGLVFVEGMKPRDPK
jgi:ubiquinone/menaquinone biosynthesis C-methylase UbiE